MKDRKVDTITWSESYNGIDFDCSLNIAINEGDPENIFLIIPGVDGSLDGYLDKYRNIADSINRTEGVTTFQMDNPYISSIHWESNVRQILDYIQLEYPKLKTIKIMAHSAGAWVIGLIANEYPEITELLLVNPASNVKTDEFLNQIGETTSVKITILVGSKDTSVDIYTNVPSNVSLVQIEGADHHFSGDALKVFIEAPKKYLYSIGV